MSTRRDPGLYPEDLPPEKLERLLREGYTVSPNSGRLRKKFSSRRKSRWFSTRKAKKYTRITLWALLIIAFVASLFIILPEMTIQNNPRNQQKIPMRR
jgi:hypothetical protein